MTLLRGGAALVAVVLAAGIIACGNEDDQAGNAAGATQTQTEAGSETNTRPADAPAQTRKARAAAAEERERHGELVRELLRGERLAEGLSYDDGSDEDEIAEIIDGMYDGLTRGRAKAVCRLMSEEAKKSMARQVKGDAGSDVVCIQSFGAFIDNATRSGELNRSAAAQITDIEIDGDDAKVKIDFGYRKREIALVREDDGWRLAATAADGS
jgi:hypothetical protein